MRKCECNATKHGELVRTAVVDAVNELVNRPGALSVLRNGGWEQWLRNLLLINLETGNLLGFTEAAFNETKRADLVFYCKRCKGVALGVEVKTNFVKQRATVTRISQAINQLGNLIRDGVPSYLVYTRTHLRGLQGDPLVSAQEKGVNGTGYKLFDIKNDAWPPNDAMDSHSYVLAGEAG